MAKASTGPDSHVTRALLGRYADLAHGAAPILAVSIGHQQKPTRG